jgi:hypothetical protein
MFIDMLELIADKLLLSLWPLLISVLVMFFYLHLNGYSYWQLHFDPHFPFIYRDHTKKYMGKTGIWYYIFFTSTAFFFVAVFMELWIDVISAARWEIKFVAIFTFFLLVPLLIFAIYKMSKEKYC